MTSDLHRNVRRSIRLRGYDYAQAGTYFVTICTRNHACLFGEVVDGEMRLNDVGRLVKDEWLRTGTIRPYVRVIRQEFVVMPNHVHGIVWLFDVAVGGLVDIIDRCDRPAGPSGRSLAAILAGFKAASTKRVSTECAVPGVSIWQCGYYEHIIRNDQSLDDIRRYIAENPMRWAIDRENPSRRNRGDRW